MAKRKSGTTTNTTKSLVNPTTTTTTTTTTNKNEREETTMNNTTPINPMTKKDNNKVVGYIPFNLSRMTVDNGIERIKSFMDEIQSNAFFIGLLLCWINGLEIPSYTSKSGATVANMVLTGTSKKSVEKVITEDLGLYSSSTLRKLYNTVKCILDNNDFEKFATADGTKRLPFKYESIYTFYTHKDECKKAKIKNVTDACNTTVKKLREAVNGGSTSNVTTATANNEDVTFQYDGNTYSVKKEVWVKFLEGCTKITK